MVSDNVPMFVKPVTVMGMEITDPGQAGRSGAVVTGASDEKHLIDAKTKKTNMPSGIFVIPLFSSLVLCRFIETMI